MRSMIKFLGLCGLLFVVSIISCPQAQALTFTAPILACNVDFSFGSTAPSCTTVGASCANAGDLMTVVIKYFQNGGTFTVTAMASSGDTWIQDADSGTGANQARIYMWHAVAATTGCNTYTATISGTGWVGGFFGIMKESGSSGAFDAVATPLTFTSFTNPQVGPNLTTTQSGDLIFAFVFCAAGSNIWGAGSGYTQIYASGSQALYGEYQIVGAGGSYNATFSNGGGCSGSFTGSLVTVAYKTAAFGTNKFVNHSTMIRQRGLWDNRRYKLQWNKNIFLI